MSLSEACCMHSLRAAVLGEPGKSEGRPIIIWSGKGRSISLDNKMSPKLNKFRGSQKQPQRLLRESLERMCFL